MPLTSLQQDLIEKLIQLDKKYQVLEQTVGIEEKFATLQTETQQSLSKLRKIEPAFSFIALALIGILLLLMLGKIIGNVDSFDLNKNVLMIFVTILNGLQVFTMKRRLAKLEKEMMLLELLAKAKQITE